MIEVMLEVPNSCAKCGRLIVGTAYAEHMDAARSGQVFDRGCAGIEEGSPAEAPAEAPAEEAPKPKGRSRR